MALTLEDIRRSVQAGEKRKFGVMKVFITGFEAPNEFPTKFWYRGCTIAKDSLLCCRAMAGPWQCKHNSLSSGTWARMYRFDVYACDSSLAPASPPVRLTMFDASTTFLGASPEAFGELDEFSQFSHVHSKTQRLQMVSIYVSFNPKDKFPIVQGLSFDEDCHIICSRPGPHTPRTPIRLVNPLGTPSAFFTPVTPTAFRTPVASASSSQDSEGESSESHKNI